MEELKLQKRKKKAERENNKQLIVSACTDLADIYVKRGEYESAIQEYEIIANIYKSENKLVEYARANRGIGEAYMGLHDFPKALEFHKRYLEVASKEKDDLEKQRAYATLGHTHLTWYLEAQVDPENNLNSAFKHFMKSLSIAQSLTQIDKLEKVDMTARLFSNLGLVKECLGEYDKALELFTRSIAICKENDIYEQLSRVYMSVASLCEKTNDNNAAIQNLNLAIDAAKKLKEVDLLCSALQAKSESLIKLADFHGAKHVLHKAYKLKTPNIQDRMVIEKNLRILVSMCTTEDRLVISSGDHIEMRKLYETMGDRACDLKNYTKAIEYYKLMLKHAERSGVSDRELAPCYYSLAETYKDDGQYKEAVEYFEKEYSLCSDLQDKLNTLSKIADTKEAAEDSRAEVREVYDRAFENCRKNKNVMEERHMVKRCIAYMRRNNHHADAFELEQHLNSLEAPNSEEESPLSDAESEHSECEGEGMDINLEELSDHSDDSDIDSNQIATNQLESSVGKRRVKTFRLKKNAKGESQLHTACINGSLPVVRHLLEQGHPVNVRDHTGWMPLHEACNYGHYEIVKLLLDKGAAVNDRGGTLCGGITPLYDAANNGHIQVVELLLDRGASPITKIDDGTSPLDILQEWHRTKRFDGEDLVKYQQVVKKMSDILEKAGQKALRNSGIRRTASLGESAGSSNNRSKDKENVHRVVQRENRNRIWDFDDDSGEIYADSTSEELSESGVGEYHRAMSNLKKRSIESHSDNTILKPLEQKSALVRDEEAFEDWLDDDLGGSKATKKRKMDHMGSLMTSTGIRSGGSGGQSTVRKSTSPPKSVVKTKSSDDLIIPDDFYDDFEDDSTITYSTRSPKKTEKRLSVETRRYSAGTKRKSQASLLEAGFSRSLSDPPPLQNTSNGRKNSSEGNKQRQQKITSFGRKRSFIEPDSTTQGRQEEMADFFPSPVESAAGFPSLLTPVASAGDLMVYVDVQINGKVFRVPVLWSQVQSQTVGWLAEQAALKYARKEGTKPKLELETTGGALLSDEDPVGLLFPLGAMQADPVVGKVIRLNLPPLVERYKEACSQVETSPNERLCPMLEEMSISLDLQNKGFLSKSLVPLCRVLNHQTALCLLDLSGNFLDSECVRRLCSALPSLANLATLNLRCTGLVCSHLAEMVGMFSPNSGGILSHLNTLDLSDNYLTDRSLKHLSQITENLTLTDLALSNVKFTSNIFSEGNVELYLKNLRAFDVSDNELETSDIQKFVSWTDPYKIRSLNVSSNGPHVNGVLRYLNELCEATNGGGLLENLNLSRCAVQENELYDLLRLCSGKNLKNINLSYNPKLTGVSLRRLLESPALQKIDLIGCDDVFKYFDDCGGCDFLQNSDELEEKQLKISGNLLECSEQVEALIRIFRRKYPECYVEKDERFLLLSSKSLKKR